MAKVIISDKLSQEGVKILQEAGCEVDCKFGISHGDLKEIIGNYEAIIIRSDTKLTKDIIEVANNLKVIGRAGVGVDNVDIEAATKKGIIVMNAPGGNTISTCEQAFALLMAVARNIPFAHSSLKNKKWERSKFKGTELYSKILGVVGLGRIGKEMVKRGIAFGMTVLAYDPFVSEEAADMLGAKKAMMKEILQKSDFVTIHTPLTDETKNFISTAELAMMKPDAIIVNCARGGIIDEDALYEALKNKKIKGAALDVFVKEPPLDSKLLELDNIVLTPHLGASTEEAQLNVAIEVAHCVNDALLGKAIRNAVNYVHLDPETYKIIEPYFSLVSKMGKFISQNIEGAAKEVYISYFGEISAYNVDILGAAFIKGFLSKQLGDEINNINALRIAKDRGLKIEQIKISEEEEYVNSIRVKIVTDKGERLLEGTLFSNKEPRFVKMDDVYIEIAPSEHMLVINNQDTPGVIGFLGTVLGKNNINIAGMSLGRQVSKNVALTIINLDSPLTKEATEQIESNDKILLLKYIKL